MMESSIGGCGDEDVNRILLGWDIRWNGVDDDIEGDISVCVLYEYLKVVVLSERT